MKFTVAGTSVELDRASVVARLADRTPEVIDTHWVNIAGVRWPAKQALEVATGVSRSRFISHHAVRIFRKLGFETSEIPAPGRPHK